MIPYNKSIEDVVKQLNSNIEEGLTLGEVKKRREQYGENKLPEGKKKSNLARFFEQFKDAMIIILLIAAAISFMVAMLEHESSAFFEPILILVIVILNALMGVMQESKAEKALDALKEMSVPHAKIIRNDKANIIGAVELVVGDLIILEAGDVVPADARLIKSSSLKAEESALTGESVPVEKDANQLIEEKSALGERINMLYSGCSITYGTASAIVTATGKDTEMGKIANLLAGEKTSATPLQERLAQLGKYLGIMALIACAVIFAIGLTSKEMETIEIFMASVSLAVSAIPEGLPAIVTIVLSIGVQRMVKKNAIVRRLPAVETLGSASVICSDKTGTLTQNKMTLVKALYVSADSVEEINMENSLEIKKLLKYATLCTDGVVEIIDGREQHVGDPTETAIVAAALKNKMIKADLLDENPRLAELPFDSDRKLMSTINRIGDENIVIVKGAVDVLVDRCPGGDREKMKNFTETLSKEALRVLGVAYKKIDKVPENLLAEEIENNLEFMGLVGMIDPPRPEAKEAVGLCKKAGIKPVMITGDHIITAQAIASEIGIMNNGDMAITGKELQAMTDQELDEKIHQISVYARVSPNDKIRIVHAWQKQDAIVSMTGDGVNDAPALKAADIGCAMGITGTEVAKGASDMILTDDNFSTIVDAVEEGRGIYDNIKKTVAFLLGTNIGEVFTVFFAMVIWREAPLLSMQLLWINLVTDSLPAIALGMEAVEADVMTRKPKAKDEGLFANGMGVRIILQGAMFAVLTLLAFYVGKNTLGQIEAGRTMAFFTLALSQVIHSYNMRSNHSMFRIGVFTNKNLNRAVGLSLLLVLLVVFVPGISYIFGLVSLTWQLYLLAIGLAFVPILVLELSKAFGLVKHSEN